MKKRSILIIDDYMETSETLKEAIEISYPDIDVDMVDNGVEGYGQACLESYDLILCDYKMPHLNGVKTGLYIKTGEDSRNHDTPIVLMSSFIPELQKSESFEFASLIIEKPVDVDKIVKKIKLLIRQNIAA
jgi:DNA-binding response OmpR family regulator